MVKVLLVEDNVHVAQMLLERMRRRGFDVLLVGDGKAALDAAARERPDVILMDLGLPVLDGWRASARLKAQPATRDIPIIALTAHVLAEQDDSGRERAWDDFATKPVDFPRLVERLHYWADRRQPTGKTPRA
jgi:two-component system, cell cycle response regulator DivK